MKMKMAPTLIALAIAAMGTTTAQAADDWYTGMGAGWAYGHDLDTFGQDADKDATALSLFGGYNFTENFAAELGYLYAGKAGVDGVDFKTQGATLSGIARLPMNDIFSVFAEGCLLQPRQRQRPERQRHLAAGGSGSDRQALRPYRPAGPLPLHVGSG
jgi:OOP family OmpA-OmpF porin